MTDPAMQWIAPVKSYTDVHEAYGNAIDVISWWLNMFGDAAVQDRIKQGVSDALNEATEAISWTGTGALVWVRVIRLEAPDTPLRVTAILGDKPSLLALGRTPSDALFNYLATDRLESAVPDGWKVDDTASYYIWITQDKPQGTIVPKGTYRELTDEVKARFSEMAIDKFTSTFKTGDILNSIVSKAKQQIADQAAKDQADQILSAIRESQARVGEIQENLKKALEDSARAANTVMLLNTLKGVLTVAQLADLAATELGKSKNIYSSDTSAQMIINRTQGIKDAIDVDRTLFQADFEGRTQEFQMYIKDLNDYLHDYAPPPSPVIQYLR